MIPLTTLLSFVFGTIIASFAGVVAERLHTGESWLSGHSRCNSCGRQLSVFDLIPIFSWVLFRGRCRTCGGKVPFLYALIEGVTGFAFALIAYRLGIGVEAIVFMGAVSVLAFIVFYDMRHTVVPRIASAILTLLALITEWIAASSVSAFGTALITAGLIGLFFLAFHVFSQGRAMGLADAPLAFALSLLVAPYAVSGVLFSFWIGAIWGIGVLVTRPGGPKMGIEVPFAPFLALGYLLAYFIQWNPLMF